MTHYDISYEGLDPIAKHNKAIEDIKEYMTEARFNKLTEEFKKYPDTTLEKFELYCSIAGVHGYPVKAWYNYCYGL